MSSQYCIISALIRPEIEEKISLGLLMFDSEKLLFSYSGKKVNISNKLMSAASQKLLRELLKNIERKIENEITLKTEFEDFRIFYNSQAISRSFKTEFFEYLSRYSNNTICFSAPKEIKLAATEDNLQRLFSKYIHKLDIVHKIERIKPLAELKNRYKEKLVQHYNIEREIRPDDVANLIAPVKIDFAGRNERDVYVQTLDMEASPSSISNDIGSLLQIKTAYKTNRKPIQDFIVAKEPPQELKKQHEIWKQLRETNLYNYVDFSESDFIVEYAEEHGVVPLFRK